MSGKALISEEFSPALGEEAVQGVRVMHGFFPGKIMLYCLEHRVNIGRNQQMKLSFAEFMELYSMPFKHIHKRKGRFLPQCGQVMKKAFILCALGFADDQAESVQMIIDVGNREPCVLPCLKST